MKEFKVMLRATSEKDFCISAKKREEVLGLTEYLLTNSNLLDFNNDEIKSPVIDCDEVDDETFEDNSPMQLPPYMTAESSNKKKSNMDIFCRNLADFCIAADCAEDVVKDGIADFYAEDFDPLLYLDFQPICSFVVEGSEDIFPDYRHNRLFGKNGVRLEVSVGGGTAAMSTVTESYELWLLEDMTLAVTFCCEMMVDDREDCQESAAYRYPVYGTPSELAGYLDLEPEDLLSSIEDMFYTARHLD